MATLTSQVGASSGAAGSQLVAVMSAPVDVHSTTNETTLLSFTLPGGGLGTANMIQAQILLSDFDTSTTNGVTFRLKYGSTTIASYIFDDCGTVSNANGVIIANMYAAGATNAQGGSIAVQVMAHNDGAESFSVHNTGTGAEDSTGDLTFSITAQPETSSASVGTTAQTGYAMLATMAA
jgi:hypothetical protein